MIHAILLAAAVAPCSSSATQMELDACWGQRATAAAATLRSTSARARATAPQYHVRATSIASAQTAWATARDRTCGLEAALYAGGSIEPMMTSKCLDALTRERTARLNALLARLHGHGRAAPLAPVSRSVDAELNRVYRLYLKQVATQPAARRTLIASEQAWIVYRDRACAIEGGSCLTDLERERVGDLEDTWLGDAFW